MNQIGRPERDTQNWIIALFRDELGYRYLGDWTHREDNSNIKEELLSRYLSGAGYSLDHITKAIRYAPKRTSTVARCMGTTRRFTAGCAMACRSRPKSERMPKPSN